jgi:hypothetical protein
MKAAWNPLPENVVRLPFRAFRDIVRNSDIVPGWLSDSR